MARALYSPHNANIIRNAAWSGTTPSPGYDLNTFAEFNPAKRVIFPDQTVTVTATCEPALADVVAVAISNLDPNLGSPPVFRLTNDAGLDVPLPIPDIPPDDLPFTLALDLRTVAGSGDLFSGEWNWVVTANSVNVRFGACFWLGTVQELCFRPGLVEGERRHNGNQANVFGTVNRVRYRTRVRSYEIDVPSNSAQRGQLFAWARDGEGSALPSLLWVDPTINDAVIGSWPDEYSASWRLPVTGSRAGYYPMAFRFEEWNKGYPLLNPTSSGSV